MARASLPFRRRHAPTLVSLVREGGTEGGKGQTNPRGCDLSAPVIRDARAPSVEDFLPNCLFGTVSCEGLLRPEWTMFSSSRSGRACGRWGWRAVTVIVSGCRGRSTIVRTQQRFQKAFF
ncbi:hypothetical protein CDAR_395981 [Caerostris darwini]|uniref:Uncharacterized protein n=1 Tax=Caerostris darwini TaxID=1538125 RepID=A0AAV4WR22_9ARAC|nr:hypothetical protein CDAR_395981 [Caerostris darwini]